MGSFAAEAASPVDVERLRPGTRVIHPEYGLGQIVAVEGEGSGRKGRVAFAVGPARTFILARSPLRPMVDARAGGTPRAAMAVPNGS